MTLDLPALYDWVTILVLVDDNVSHRLQHSGVSVCPPVWVVVDADAMREAAHVAVSANECLAHWAQVQQDQVSWIVRVDGVTYVLGVEDVVEANLGIPVDKLPSPFTHVDAFGSRVCPHGALQFMVSESRGCTPLVRRS